MRILRVSGVLSAYVLAATIPGYLHIARILAAGLCCRRSKVCLSPILKPTETIRRVILGCENKMIMISQILLSTLASIVISSSPVHIYHITLFLPCVYHVSQDESSQEAGCEYEKVSRRLDAESRGEFGVVFAPVGMYYKFTLFVAQMLSCKVED
jgi:hypothetical protein